ncbi:Crp/Fnr family transcriptional regulator [Chondrinema litorale]|uniref:Crp/Fnr family transcriptional regulator n=1 Tax=Chondrinema litorale TaxID=2994555 RepID=UPI00254360A3|nr:Crp/Fnr family transcriptional regulator [Chondrinema litorale]UZR93833.1 Crp/Fnr family transcriptional regulator [Chondrinema litorale]
MPHSDLKDKLINYFLKFAELTQEEKQAIADSANILEFKKGTVLLEQGQISKEIYFVLKGCVREFYVIEGEEKTSNFFTEEQWVISLKSNTHKTPADHFYDCLEYCTLLVADEEKYNPMYEAFPRFERISIDILQHEFAVQQDMQATYVTNSAEQRYLNLLKNRPDLLQRVPQYQLASFIGVKPETLSRIRRRLAAK